MFIFGSTLVIGTGGKAENKAWIAILIAAALSIPVLLMYARILYLHPGKNLYNILEEVFGKILGKLFSIIYIWFFFHLSALVLRNFGEFINNVGLTETPRIVPILMFGVVCALGVKAGIEVLARCSSYFIIFVVSFITVITCLSIPIIDIDKLLPITVSSINPIMHGAFDAFGFPFGELVVFLALFDSLETKSQYSKVYLKSLLVVGLIVAFVTARNISGSNSYNIRDKIKGEKKGRQSEESSSG